MKGKELRSSVLLLITAAIWGFAFVAQRVGMKHIGPFTYSGVRFALGSLSLLPIIFFMNRREKGKEENLRKNERRDVMKYGAIAGSILFLAASLQQVGLLYTTAGKAGFITSLYIVIVPIIGIVLKHKAGLNIWVGAIVAAVGLYFLSINEDFTIEFGDFLELVGAVFWGLHIIVIGSFVSKVDAVKLSSTQFAVCAILSLIAAFMFEDVNMEGISAAAIPILYGGLISAGIAYTIQAVAQKSAKASHAAIALSMEAVFAAIGGILLLGETLPLRGYMGCLLMLAGMLISQADNFKKRTRNALDKAGAQ
jgi:drug/metabolite transporter (DMT)-like permease